MMENIIGLTHSPLTPACTRRLLPQQEVFIRACDVQLSLLSPSLPLLPSEVSVQAVGVWAL